MDDQLNDLLDDALADFDKKPSELYSETSKSEKKATVAKEEKPGSSGAAKTQEASSHVDPPKNLFNEFFDQDVTKKLQEEWESAMKELVEEDPELASHLNKLSSTLEEDVKDEKTSSPSQGPKKEMNLDEAMSATISGMQKSAEDLKNMSSENAQEKMMRDMKNLGVDMLENLGDMDGTFISMMEGMMKNLLSKDILYPTMKQLSTVYPGWLESNKEKEEPGKMKKYEKQSLLICKICEKFEREKESDTDEQKRKGMNEIMDLVEDMQQCGNPPPQLLESLASPPPEIARIFGGETSNLNMNPQDINPDCSVM